MRYSEISSLPSSTAEANESLIDLVTVYRSRDAASIPMDEILAVLHNQGFDADQRWVMDALTDKPGIKRIEKNQVVLQQDDVPDEVASPDEQQISQDKVSQMAAKAAKKSMSNG